MHYVVGEFAVQDLTLFRGGELLWHQLAFTLKNSEALMIQGPNGSGKSSLLQVLCGQLASYSGQISWLGRSTDGPHREAYLQQLFYSGHTLGLKNDMSVLANIRWRMALCGEFPADAAIQAALEKFNLGASYQHKTLNELSYGQKRRVLMVCLWLNLKKRSKVIWILDEPLVGLDATALNDLKNIFEEHLDNGGILVMTSHQGLSLNGQSIRTLSLSTTKRAEQAPLSE